MEVFHSGRALKADNKIPVYTPRISENTSITHEMISKCFLKKASKEINMGYFQSHFGKISLIFNAHQISDKGVTTISVQAPHDMGDSIRMVV